MFPPVGSFPERIVRGLRLIPGCIEFLLLGLGFDQSDTELAVLLFEFLLELDRGFQDFVPFLLGLIYQVRPRP